MKSLKLSLALIVTLGLGSVALADDAAATAAPCNSGCGGCGHGLLSMLSLHRCNTCCDAPKPCPTPCDPCAGHNLIGMLHCIKLPSLHCGSCGGCAPKCCERPKCEPKPCAPKCCAPKPCAPKCCHEFHMPQICLPKIKLEWCCKPACEPKPCCKPACPKPCAPKCCKPACPKPCDPCGCHLPSLAGLFHHGCCEAPKPACDPCAHRCNLSLSSILGKRCCPCEGAAAPAEKMERAPEAKEMKSTGTNSNGLLILTPAG